MTTSLLTATDAPVAPGFAELHLSEPVLRALDTVGYTDPTPVQSATYPAAIAGRDIIVQARTGTGKTAAFGIPLVDKLVTSDPWVQALVLAPTRELAVQSQREIARLGQFKGLHTVAIYGGAPMGRQVEELQSGAQIVSGTPGRVLDHLRRGTLEPSRLKVLVLDEMDEMLSMGFAKELNAILEMLPPRGRRQTMCFSATVDGEIRRHAERHMHEPDMISLSSDAVAAQQITHQVYMVTGSNRIGDLVHVLEVEDPQSAIIFCNMRSETERVAMGLQQAGFNADWLNGDLPQRDRERIMAATREGKLRYLVATDVAARGIDISHLTHVINFTFPESAAVYVHRTGRTGRAGRTGCAISLVGPEELGRLYYLRLEYKISPVERSLPTSGERKTQKEIDRIGLLESAFADAPNPNDLAVARRLLTHPESERILAGLLHTFFGTKEDVDDEAAAARRSRLGPNLDAGREPRRSNRPESRERDRDRGRGRERDRDRDRDRDHRGRRDRRDDTTRELRVADDGALRQGVEPDLANEARSGEDAEGSTTRARDNALDSGVPGDSPRERGPRDAGPRESGGRREGGARERSAREGGGRERSVREGGRREPAARDRSRGGSAAAGQDREGLARESADRDLTGDSEETESLAANEAARSPEGRDPRRREPGRERRRERDGRRQERQGSQTRLEGADELGPGAIETEATNADEQLAADSGNREPRRRSGNGSAGRREPRREPLEGAEAEAQLDDVRGERREAGEPRREPKRPRARSNFPPPSAASAGSSALDGELLPSEPDAAEDEVGGESSEQLSGLLYLNLGKRDGIRIGEVARLLRESCELSRSEIGRIRVRDRYTFVDVPEERLDAIISTLSGQVVHDKPLAPERAKTAKT